MLFIFTKKQLEKTLNKFLDGKQNILQQVEDLKLKKTELEEEIAKLKLNKEIEEEKIKHLVKIKKEKNSLEMAQKEIVLQKKFQEQEQQLLVEHHNKTLTLLEEGKKDLKDIYKEILLRLPNVNVKMNGKI